MRKLMMAALFALPMFGATAMAQDTLKIAWIDPLSGGGASVGERGLSAGIRILTQGNGSSVAGALTDFVAKYNERNPGKEVLYLNYAAVDPVLTNEKCSFWHFRWDANSDIKMEALTNYMKGIPSIKKLYLINQDYSFGQSVRSQARAMLAAKRPDI
jgi:branched-chain amino acid transport system substrate-binding protein